MVLIAPSARVAVAYVHHDRSRRGAKTFSKAVLSSWAREHGTRIGAWFDDQAVAHDALIDERPGLIDALDAMVRENAGVLVVPAREHLGDEVVSACVEHLVSLRRASVAFVAPPSGCAAAAHERILLAFIQHDRAAYRARSIRRVKTYARKQRRGEWVGAPPWGFRLSDDGLVLEPDPGEQRITALVQHMSIVGGYSIRRIVALLKKRSVVGRTGKPLGSTQVFHLLHQP